MCKSEAALRSICRLYAVNLTACHFDNDFDNITHALDIARPQARIEMKSFSITIFNSITVAKLLMMFQLTCYFAHSHSHSQTHSLGILTECIHLLLLLKL